MPLPAICSCLPPLYYTYPLAQPVVAKTLETEGAEDMEAVDEAAAEPEPEAEGLGAQLQALVLQQLHLQLPCLQHPPSQESWQLLAGQADMYNKSGGRQEHMAGSGIILAGMGGCRSLVLVQARGLRQDLHHAFCAQQQLLQQQHQQHCQLSQSSHPPRQHFSSPPP